MKIKIAGYKNRVNNNSGFELAYIYVSVKRYLLWRQQMKIRCLIFLISITLCINNKLTAQSDSSYAINGTVTESETKQPLEGVNVFLDGTTIGTTSDMNGFFEITNVKRGGYVLVLSMIGFSVESKKIEIPQRKFKSIEVVLKPKSYEMPVINVIASVDDEWADQYKKFLTNFIGDSENAEECEILNKEQINFTVERKTGEFSAHSNEWLEIINKALGYKVFFNIRDFSVSGRGETRYLGEIRFSELESDSAEEIYKWKLNRLKAHKGSLRHFLSALWKNKLFKEDFLIYESETPNWKDLTKKNSFVPDVKQITQNISDWEKGLAVSNFIKVVYLKESEDENFCDYRKSYGSKIESVLDKQTSWFKLQQGFITFDKSGNTLEENRAIKVYGYWGWQRIADLLPKDYVGE